MPFGIPSEDFHGGFGLPYDDVCVINYDDTDGDVSNEDREIVDAAQEAHDELVRSLIEAGGEIRELKEMLHDAKDALLYMSVLHDSTHGHNMQKAVQILYYLQSDNRWNVQKAKETLKKISDYLEQENA